MPPPTSEFIIDMREFLERIIDEKDTLYDQRFRASEAAYDQRFRASEIAVQAALQAQKEAVSNTFIASEKAIIKAEVATEKRFESVNEFRATLSDLQLTYMSRLEASALFKATDEKLVVMQNNNDARFEALRQSIEKNSENINKDVSSLREYRSESSGKSSGANALWGYFVAGLGLLVGLAGFVSHFIGK